MKKSAIISILSLLLILMFVACDKQCHHKWADSEIPPLSDTGYNSCKAVVYNYTLFEHEEQDRILELDCQQIVKACGWIKGDPHHYGYCSLADDSTSSEPEISIPLYAWGLPDSVDFDATKKCYIIGRLTFGLTEWKKSCIETVPRICPFEFYFE